MLFKAVESSIASLKPLLVSALTPIPVDISSVDAPYVPRSLDPAAPALLEPITTIVQLEGAANLGVLLWAFVLYQGPFTTSGRPAEWVLPIVAKGLNCEKEQWYLDYKEGFKFSVPPAVELVRVLFFLSLGYYVDMLTIASFDGDSYWGWAISGSLFIPVGLLALARGAEKAETREEKALADEMRRDFSAFGASRLTRHDPRTPLVVNGRNKVYQTAEASLILAFRRSFDKYRDEAVVPTKQIKRIVRAWVGYKPTADGQYLHLELQNLRRESKEALAENLKKAEALRQAALLERSGSGDASGGMEELEGDEPVGFGNEFVRSGPIAKRDG